MSFSKKRQFGFVRSLVAIFGACSVAWAVWSISIHGAEGTLADIARDIMLGDVLDARQLDPVRRDSSAVRAESLRSLALMDLVVVRLRLLEEALSSGESKAIANDLDDVEAVVTTALASVPTSSFLWLAKYWLEAQRAGLSGTALNHLDMSYSMGPNEAWIALRRNPLALSIFPSLQQTFAERVVGEFKGLVRSGLYPEAANILAGPGWPVRGKLLGSLAGLSEDNRRGLAKALESKGVDDAIVPGIERRPSRPF